VRSKRGSLVFPVNKKSLGEQSYSKRLYRPFWDVLV